MDKHRKAKVAEQALFAMLLAAIGAAAFFHERFRTEVPDWQLFGLTIAGMCASFIAYRLALNFVVRKLES
jgi:drug/metabolite transporter (DMT)-like permease